MSQLLAGLAVTMGVAMALSPLLQMRLILRERHSEEVSQGFLLVITMGASAWLAHGLNTGDLIIIIPNACGLLCALATLIVARRFRLGDPGRLPLIQLFSKAEAARRTHQGTQR